MTELPNFVAGKRIDALAILRSLAIGLFITLLAWAPFPLGGAIAWASGLQTMLIAACCILWCLGSINSPERLFKGSRILIIPGLLVAGTLLWAGVQLLADVPAGWGHPIWTMASEALAKPLGSHISINPWRTEAELIKLASYVMAVWLVFRMARRAETAKFLLNATIVIGALYAIYAFALYQSGFQQTDVFYSVKRGGGYVSGPFMLHNSFATYSGMVAIAATVRLFAEGSAAKSDRHEGRRWIQSILQFCSGRGAPILIAVLTSFSAVVASASRAGFAATLCGLVTIALVALLLTRGRQSFWPLMGAIAAASPIFLIVIINGGDLANRVDQLLASDAGDKVRYALWAASQRMIADAPFLGLGLGTFEDAYPLYATQFFPFVMDKAHCDYLEFAAGLGLAAATAWWLAILWLCGLFLRAIIIRHRNRYFAIIALGASAIVAVHSSVDFSLQLPAVALLYATLLGLGLGQCQSSQTY